MTIGQERVAACGSMPLSAMVTTKTRRRRKSVWSSTARSAGERGGGKEDGWGEVGDGREDGEGADDHSRESCSSLASSSWGRIGESSVRERRDCTLGRRLNSGSLFHPNHGLYSGPRGPSTIQGLATAMTALPPRRIVMSSTLSGEGSPSMSARKRVRERSGQAHA